MKMRYLRVIAFILIAAICLQADLFAQIQSERHLLNVKVRGVVRDDAGATLPHATVTFKSKKLKKKVEVDEEGAFEIDLPVGLYKVVAKAEGCREFKLKELSVQPEPLTKLEITVKCPPTPIYGQH